MTTWARTCWRCGSKPTCWPRAPASGIRACTRARSTLSQIDATIKSVRQIINDLRPNVLDLGLAAAVEWQIAEFKRRTGIACELIDATEGSERARPLRDRLLPHPAGVAQQYRAPRQRHQGAVRCVPAAS
jgi:signal transduction histidine kinase